MHQRLRELAHTLKDEARHESAPLMLGIKKEPSRKIIEGRARAPRAMAQQSTHVQRRYKIRVTAQCLSECLLAVPLVTKISVALP